MAPDVQPQHIELYVNEFTRDLGDEGYAAVDALLDPRARRRAHAARAPGRCAEPVSALAVGRGSGVEVVGERAQQAGDLAGLGPVGVAAAAQRVATCCRAA